MIRMKKFDPNEQILKQAYAFPNDDELAVAEVLAKSTGEQILFLAPHLIQGARTPDLKIGDKLWEIKIPKGKGKFTIRHALKAAVRQSENIVFDLRNWKLPEQKAISQIKNEFKISYTAKRVKIILKSEKILDLEK